MYGECERCKNIKTEEELKKEWLRHESTRTKLLGDYAAILCCGCTNAWHELVDGDTRWEEMNDLQTEVPIIQSRLHHRGGEPDEVRLRETVRRIRVLNREFYAFAKAFVAGR